VGSKQGGGGSTLKTVHFVVLILLTAAGLVVGCCWFFLGAEDADIFKQWQKDEKAAYDGISKLQHSPQDWEKVRRYMDRLPQYSIWRIDTEKARESRKSTLQTTTIVLGFGSAILFLVVWRNEKKQKALERSEDEQWWTERRRIRTLEL